MLGLVFAKMLQMYKVLTFPHNGNGFSSIHDILA